MLTDCEGTLTPTASRTFTAQCLTVLPNFLNAYNIWSGGATVAWYSMTGLPGLVYRVRWRPVGTTTWAESSTLVNALYTITGLTTNTVYEWQLQPICDGVGATYVAALTNFTTTCRVATAYVPSPSDTWVQLMWSGIPNEQYALEYRVQGAATWTSTNSLTGNLYTLTVTPGTAYEYRIRTACSDGNTGVVSNVVAFTTLPACDPLEPNNTPETAVPLTGTSYTSVVLCMNRPGDEDWFRWQHNGHEYLILVRSGSMYYLGNYRLSLDLSGNTLTVRTEGAGGSIPYVILRLMAVDGITVLAYGNSGSSTFPQLTYTLPATPCTMMTTVKNGNWTDASTWSCNRLPIATDAVQVLHQVTVLPYQTGRAKGVGYGSGGKVIMQTGSRLILGQ